MQSLCAPVMTECCAPQFDSTGVFHYTTVQPRQLSIMQRIEPFFTPAVVCDTLRPLVNQQSAISLRALDWLVTNYAKKHNVVCKSTRGGIFNIFHGYKVALNHFRRRNFDPFRRRARIHLFVDGVSVCESTVGQCNFVHWACCNGVMAYAVEHAQEIEADMNRASAIHKAERRTQKNNGVPHRRKELSPAPLSKCSIYNIVTRVSFNQSSAASDSATPVDDMPSEKAWKVC